MIKQVPEEVIKTLFADKRVGQPLVELIESIIRQLEEAIAELEADLPAVKNDMTKEVITASLAYYRENLKRAELFMKFKYLLKGNFGNEA